MPNYNTSCNQSICMHGRFLIPESLDRGFRIWIKDSFNLGILFYFVISFLFFIFASFISFFSLSCLSFVNSPCIRVRPDIICLVVVLYTSFLYIYKKEIVVVSFSFFLNWPPYFSFLNWSHINNPQKPRI